MNNPSRTIMNGVYRLTAMADVAEVVHGLAELLRRSAGSSWTSVWLYDRIRGAFQPAVAEKVPLRLAPLFGAGAPLPLEEVPAAEALRKRRHRVLAPRHFGAAAATEAKAALLRYQLLLFPLVVRNEAQGILILARKRTLPPLSAEELSVVGKAVSYAALVVNHILLFDESLDLAVELGKRIDVILSLDEINKAISSTLSRRTIIDTAIRNLERVASCSGVAILEQRKGELQVTASFTRDEELARLLLPGARSATGTCVVGTAFARNRICSTRRTEPPPPGSLEESLLSRGISTLLAIPLVSRQEPTGVLLLVDRQREEFAAEEIFTVEKIAAQLAVALENARLYEDLEALFISTVSSLANAIDAKSHWTKGHSERVMHTCGRIGREMGLPEETVQRVRIGGLLHDVGKIGIVESVLEKPDRLSDHESPAMKLHPQKGVAILSPISQLQGVLPAILHHHERYDGTGYPDGLKGEAIPLEARIVAVADAFDAMVADRPYRKGGSVDDALRELRACAGTQFDPAVVDAFGRYIARQRRQQNETAAAPAAPQQQTAGGMQ